jgi:hypothetical protein
MSAIVRVVNNETPVVVPAPTEKDPDRTVTRAARTIELAWNGEKWRLAPGDSEFVPIEAAIRSFGDPYLVDEPTNPSRSQEYDRIRTFWGVYADDMKLHHFPAVEVFSSKGEPLAMVLHDPTGETLKPVVSDVALDASASAITARLDAIEAENRSLREELQRRQLAAAEAASTAPMLALDGPMLPTRETPEELAGFDDLTIEEMTAQLAAKAHAAKAHAAKAVATAVESPANEPIEGSATPTDAPPAVDGKPLKRR